MHRTTPLDDAAAESSQQRAAFSGDRSSGVYVASQEHLLKPTQDNPMPTAVPPPIAATSGTLGDRHVFILIGLPERGKPFIARRLQAYLSFFHGAEVQLHDLVDYQKRTGAAAGSEENAQLLLDDLRSFMGGQSQAAARNMAVPCPPSARPSGDLEEDSQEHRELVDEHDKRRKNVDSGKVAIIYTTDSFSSFSEKWSGTSKERRRWASDTLKRDRALGAKLIFIEVTA